MTMVVIACAEDRAFVMTDTASYSKWVELIRQTSKVDVLPHLSAAIVTQGDSGFGALVKAAIREAAAASETYDDLVAAAPDYFGQVWDTISSDLPTDGPGAWLEPSTVLLVGYSTTAGRFVGYGFASSDYFEPFELGDLWMVPTPWQMRPGPRELADLREFTKMIEGADELFDLWAIQPEPTAPTSLHEFTRLAQQIRVTRAQQDFCKVIVGGRAFLTILEPEGQLQNVKLLDYGDDGPDFLELVNGTAHPLAQVAPCDCGSERPWIQCCDAGSDPCRFCQSGKPLAECCAIDAEQIPDLLEDRQRRLAMKV
ncbi:hypothetical protein [Nocardioides sp. Kera G14]|uniref:hypothetical protein n=1 Tax=Nocardioides sp. Kera G14 TaxID=2884264 RepID=UPI001D10AB78|nr:hypothetical protein [Nocardioides sp. Kera G14]UDY22391.1 hypothetical protein LH076_09895 [Nocardioides sp. Kera G14]